MKSALNHGHFYLLGFLLVIVGSCANNGYRFFYPEPRFVKVYLKDGSTLIGEYFEKISMSRGKEEKVIRLDRDGRKIKPSETDSIIIDFQVGIPFLNNSCWIFKIIDGDVCAYSTIPKRKTKKITHIQKAEGEIKSFSRDLLSNYLSANEPASKLFRSTWAKSETRKQHLGAKEAILEYNFHLREKERAVDSLLLLIKNEKDISVKSAYAEQVLAIDSTNHRAFEILGDYELQINNDEEKAYEYYTNANRYCPNKLENVTIVEKIKQLKKPVLY